VCSQLITFEFDLPKNELYPSRKNISADNKITKETLVSSEICFGDLILFSKGTKFFNKNSLAILRSLDILWFSLYVMRRENMEENKRMRRKLNRKLAQPPSSNWLFQVLVLL